MKTQKLDVTYFNENSNKYEDVCQELNHRSITYGDMQCVSYMPDEKRAILCRKILNSCATRGEILTNDYKQLIELIANHPKIGTSLTPVFMYNNKPCDCSTIKMTITEFRKKLKYNLKGDEFNSKLNIIYNLTTIIYTIAIVNDDVYVRYHTLVDHNDFLT